jgi:hypothetical protein
LKAFEDRTSGARKTQKLRERREKEIQKVEVVFHLTSSNLYRFLFFWLFFSVFRVTFAFFATGNLSSIA